MDDDGMVLVVVLVMLSEGWFQHRASLFFNVAIIIIIH
jgi:hypothetical protein